MGRGREFCEVPFDDHRGYRAAGRGLRPGETPAGCSVSAVVIKRHLKTAARRIAERHHPFKRIRIVHG